MKELVIVGMARTAIGDFLGDLKDISAVNLGVVAAKAALERSGIKPGQINDVAAGMVYKAGAKGNPARQIQLALEIPKESVALTIDQQCASSMRALEIVAQQILLEKTSIGLVCGIESMSNVPYLMLKARDGLRMGDGVISDGLTHDALFDAFLNYHMGITAETLAEKYDISREDQDHWAATSHSRAVAAIKKGYFSEEIAPVKIENKKGVKTIDVDEHPNANLTIDALAKMKPAFKKDGTVTAGNASSINDGASAMVVMTLDNAEKLGLQPIAKILSTASCGVSPNVMGIGPVDCIPLALKYAKKEIKEVDYFEINEAFAAQFLACKKVLNISDEIINANGSGISLGHPVGCTGIRLVMAAVNELRRRNGKIGVASLCAGGGPAMAVVVELI